LTGSRAGNVMAAGASVTEATLATVSRLIQAPPVAVFAILADGWYYSGWVVGTSHMRAVESEWPAVGSRLFHSSGIWPAALKDETFVEECETNHRLVMVARGWPLGEARIELTLDPEGPATRVTMAESPVRGPGAWINNPLGEAVLHRRNVESLARLAALAEHRTGSHA
jgi:uncharacterized protein YndB with AHSA1/START domain